MVNVGEGVRNGEGCLGRRKRKDKIREHEDERVTYWSSCSHQLCCASRAHLFPSLQVHVCPSPSLPSSLSFCLLPSLSFPQFSSPPFHFPFPLLSSPHYFPVFLTFFPFQEAFNFLIFVLAWQFIFAQVKFKNRKLLIK